ncbi:sulfotransferase domain-containing protein [candidate division KSB1 bacterium]|nr:sulfotransferase domain-containing protein [candidate division KSB1 bacterium]
MKNFLKKILQRNSNNEIIIVSGLPRSGTSMMMKMFDAGEVEIVTDNIRKADEDNPKGYYEFEKVKKIKEDHSWLDDCEGKAVKMISALLLDLPGHKKYKIIFMRRNMAEILASQKQMLTRMGKEEVNQDDEDIATSYKKHLSKVFEWLEKQKNIDVLYMNYNEILKQAKENVVKLDTFLNVNLNTENMVKVVDNSLYRQRK